MKKIVIVLIVVLLLCSGLAVAGFWEDLTGKISFNLKNLLSKRTVRQADTIQTPSKSISPIATSRTIPKTKPAQMMDRDISKYPTQASALQISMPMEITKTKVPMPLEEIRTTPSRRWQLTKTIQNKLFVHELIVHPEDENKLIIIAGEGNVEPTSIYISNDGGDTWTNTMEGRLGNIRTEVSKIVMDKRNPNTVYASRFGGKLYRSENFGQTWKELIDLSISNEHIGSIYHLAIDINNPNKIYIFPATRLPREPGVFILNIGLSGYDLTFHTYGVTLNPGEDGPLLWDSVQNEDNGYLFIGFEYSSKPDNWELYKPPILRSTDGGITWEDISPRNSPNKVLSDDPACSNLYSILYDDPIDMLYNTNHVHFMEIDQQNNIIYFADEGPRFFKSEDNGETYEFLSCSPFFWYMELNKNNPSEIIGGQRDSCFYYPEVSCCQDPSERLNCVGGQGKIWSTEDSGETLNLISSPALNVVDIDYTGDYSSFYVSSYGRGIHKFGLISPLASQQITAPEIKLREERIIQEPKKEPKLAIKKNPIKNLFNFFRR